ncbi:MAG: hypothetical protein PHI55_10680 [Burkholderiaceae bacterium]|nr:hypothetical protein [Burkholderiaceae bacterium]
MLTTEELERAGSYVERLRLSVHELDVPSTNRARAAGSCLAIAQEHHHAIVRLIEERLFASSFALLRIEFEAYVRGEWLLQCASDLIVEAFLRGKEPPKIDCLLADLEMLDSFNENMLSQIKRNTWKSMCAYTHTGGLHVQRWNTEDGIEANYSRDEVLEVLKFAETIASLAVIGAARLAGKDELAVRTLDAFKKRIDGN